MIFSLARSERNEARQTVGKTSLKAGDLVMVNKWVGVVMRRQDIPSYIPDHRTPVTILGEVDTNSSGSRVGSMYLLNPDEVVQKVQIHNSRIRIISSDK